jgi:hypothetical protein
MGVALSNQSRHYTPAAGIPVRGVVSRCGGGVEKSRNEAVRLILAGAGDAAAEPVMKGCYYMLGQWPKLITFLTQGEAPLDNNRCENAIRPFVVGKKGWMFSDTVTSNNGNVRS